MPGILWLEISCLIILAEMRGLLSLVQRDDQLVPEGQP